MNNNKYNKVSRKKILTFIKKDNENVYSSSV